MKSARCALCCAVQRTLTVHTTGPTTATANGPAAGAKAGEKENKEAAAGAGYQDTRVHCCLYLIAPTGHSLKALDLVTMKKLHDKMNLVPVIAKSDTITKQELAAFKTRVRAARAYSPAASCLLFIQPSEYRNLAYSSSACAYSLYILLVLYTAYSTVLVLYCTLSVH